MTDLLTRALGAALMIAPALALMWLGSRAPSPVPRQTPAAASRDAEWLALPFQAVGALAGLCWLAIGLCVFLAPLALLVLWVVR